MSRPFTIENDSLCFDVWPQLGGKVSSVVDKADHHELLFNYPAEIPSGEARYDQPYGDSWYSGWDECFPAVAPCRYAGFPYDGIAVPDHGELWGLPTTAVPTKNGITTVWHGLRFGYRLTRKLYLDGPSLIAEYTLVNLAPFEFRSVWAQHALLAMTGPMELDFGADTMQWRHSQEQSGKPVDQLFDWPNLAPAHDCSRPDQMPPGRAWKLFMPQPIAAPAIVRYPRRARTLTVEFSSDDGLAAYWGLWINTGGWNGHRHFSLEPTTGRFDQLDRSIADGSAARTAPLGKCQWTLRWTVAPAS